MKDRDTNSGEREMTDGEREQAGGGMQEGMRRIDELIERLERAGEQLRSGELSADAAATLVEDCAALATQASAQIESMARSDIAHAVPGQESLL